MLLWLKIIRLKNSSKNLEWLNTELWLTGRYASHSECIRQKPKDRISTKSWNPWFENTETNHPIFWVQTNKLQGTWMQVSPSKVKDDEKIAQESIREHERIKVGNIL